MKERVQRLVGGRTAARMWVMTFHAACGRLLRRDAERIGYRSSFTIYDQADQVRLVKACIEELELDPKRFAPRAVHTAISRAKDRLLTAEAYGDQVGNFFEQTVASVYALYQRRLYAANAMDFDDMILQTVLLLEADAEARAAWQERFSHIMVDEYQDTNHAQFRLLSRAGREAPQHRRRRRPRPVDLCVPRGRHPQHRRVRARLPRRARGRARAELPLDPGHPRRRQRGHRAQSRPPAQAAVVGARPRAAGAGRRGRRRARRGPLRRRRDRPGDRRGRRRRPTSRSSTA